MFNHVGWWMDTMHNTMMHETAIPTPQYLHSRWHSIVCCGCHLFSYGTADCVRPLQQGMCCTLDLPKCDVCNKALLLVYEFCLTHEFCFGLTIQYACGWGGVGCAV